MKSLIVLFIVAAVIMNPVDIMSSNTSWDGTAGLLRVYGANTVGNGKLVFSLGTSYSKRSDVPINNLGAMGTDPKVNYNFFITRAGINSGIE